MEETMETQLSAADSVNQEELKDLLSMVAMMRGFLNDHVIKDISGTVSTLSRLAVAMSGTDLVEILEKALQDPELDKALVDPPRVGITGLMKSMGDADVQRGMGIMIQILRALGKAAAQNS